MLHVSMLFSRSLKESLNSQTNHTAKFIVITTFPLQYQEVVIVPSITEQYYTLLIGLDSSKRTVTLLF